MTQADENFIKTCKEIIEHGYSSEGTGVRTRWEDGAEANYISLVGVTNKYDLEKDVAEQKQLWMVRALESASILGAKNIVVHSLNVPEGVSFEEYNIEYYKSFIPYCEKFGIHVAVENLFTRDQKRKYLKGKIGSPEELNNIVQKINYPNKTYLFYSYQK